MRTKKFFALLIILSGVGVSLILINHGSGKNSNLFGFATKPGNNPSLNYKNSASISSAFSNQDPTPDKTKMDNMTDALINSYVREFASLNQNGLQTINGKTGIKPISEGDFQNLIAEKINEDVAFEYFSEKDIKISEDDSKENQIAYLLNVAKAMNKYKTSFKTDIFSAIENNFKKNDSSALERFVNNMPELIENLLVLQPPKNFITLHLQLLNYWQKKLAYYEAIINLQEDPLKAYIALDNLKNILQEGLDLSNVIVKQYRFLKS